MYMNFGADSVLIADLAPRPSHSPDVGPHYGNGSHTTPHVLSYPLTPPSATSTEESSNQSMPPSMAPSQIGSPGISSQADRASHGIRPTARPTDDRPPTDSMTLSSEPETSFASSPPSPTSGVHRPGPPRPPHNIDQNITVPVIIGQPFQVNLTEFLPLENANDVELIEIQPSVVWVQAGYGLSPNIYGTVPMDLSEGPYPLRVQIEVKSTSHRYVLSVVLDAFKIAFIEPVPRGIFFVIDVTPLLRDQLDEVSAIETFPVVDWLALNPANRSIYGIVPLEVSLGPAVNVTIFASTEDTDLKRHDTSERLRPRAGSTPYEMLLVMDIYQPSNDLTASSVSLNQPATTLQQIRESSSAGTSVPSLASVPGTTETPTSDTSAFSMSGSTSPLVTPQSTSLAISGNFTSEPQGTTLSMASPAPSATSLGLEPDGSSVITYISTTQESSATSQSLDGTVTPDVPTGTAQQSSSRKTSSTDESPYNSLPSQSGASPLSGGILSTISATSVPTASTPNMGATAASDTFQGSPYSTSSFVLSGLSLTSSPPSVPYTSSLDKTSAIAASTLTSESLSASEEPQSPQSNTVASKSSLARDLEPTGSNSFQSTSSHAKSRKARSSHAQSSTVAFLAAQPTSQSSGNMVSLSTAESISDNLSATIMQTPSSSSLDTPVLPSTQSLSAQFSSATSIGIPVQPLSPSTTASSSQPSHHSRLSSFKPLETFTIADTSSGDSSPASSGPTSTQSEGNMGSSIASAAISTASAGSVNEVTSLSQEYTPSSYTLHSSPTPASLFSAPTSNSEMPLQSSSSPTDSQNYQSPSSSLSSYTSQSLLTSATETNSLFQASGQSASSQGAQYSTSGTTTRHHFPSNTISTIDSALASGYMSSAGSSYYESPSANTAQPSASTTATVQVPVSQQSISQTLGLPSSALLSSASLVGITFSSQSVPSMASSQSSSTQTRNASTSSSVGQRQVSSEYTSSSPSPSSQQLTTSTVGISSTSTQVATSDRQQTQISSASITSNQAFSSALSIYSIVSIQTTTSQPSGTTISSAYSSTYTIPSAYSLMPTSINPSISSQASPSTSQPSTTVSMFLSSSSPPSFSVLDESYSAGSLSWSSLGSSTQSFPLTSSKVKPLSGQSSGGMPTPSSPQQSTASQVPTSGTAFSPTTNSIQLFSTPSQLSPSSVTGLLSTVAQISNQGLSSQGSSSSITSSVVTSSGATTTSATISLPGSSVVSSTVALRSSLSTSPDQLPAASLSQVSSLTTPVQQTSILTTVSSLLTAQVSSGASSLAIASPGSFSSATSPFISSPSSILIPLSTVSTSLSQVSTQTSQISSQISQTSTLSSNPGLSSSTAYQSSTQSSSTSLGVSGTTAPQSSLSPSTTSQAQTSTSQSSQNTVLSSTTILYTTMTLPSNNSYPTSSSANFTRASSPAQTNSSSAQNTLISSTTVLYTTMTLSSNTSAQTPSSANVTSVPAQQTTLQATPTTPTNVQATTSTTSGYASPTLFFNDFNSGNATCWQPYGGTWIVSNGEYNQTDQTFPGGKSVYQCPPDNFANFTLDALVTLNNYSTAGNTDAGVLFRVSNPSNGGPDSYNGYYAGISGNNYAVIGMANGGWNPGPQYTMTILQGVQYHLRVKIVANTFQVFVTNMNTPVITWTESTWTTGAIGIREYMAAAAWDNFLVSSV